MVKGVIVADDLTGAADACATFVARGRSGAVVFDAEGQADVDVDVVTVSTDSRGLPVTLAVDRVHDTVRRLAAAHPSALLFKKIDSTLRGHVGREIAATMEASGARLAIVAPAFPAMGRTVRDGVLAVTGAGTLKPRHVKTLLEEQGVGDCRHLARPASADADGARDHDECGALTDTAAGWRDSMTAAMRAGARVLVCDSVSDDDLDAIVRAASSFDSGGDGRLLWVGSAGLADAIAREVPRFGEASVRTASVRAASVRTADVDAPAPAGGANGEPGAATSRDPVVFWIGSHHPVTVEQRRKLLARPGVAAVGGTVNGADRVARLLDRRVHPVLDVGPAVSDETIAQFVERVVERPVAGFVMSGGETAARVCRLLDASAIRLAGEVSRGIPHGTLFSKSGLTRSSRRWPIVLKSGGFGTPRALLDVLAFLCPHTK